MPALIQTTGTVARNRRRRVRQKVHAPAYATFRGASRSEMLNLYEVLDISEVGVAVQCASPMEVGQQVELCLDLAEASGEISTTARIIWADATGRAGLALPGLTNSTLHCLREWLFLNAMAAAANAAASTAAVPSAPEHSEWRPDYTDTLTAASAVQHEAESLGSDLEAVLFLVASRSHTLLRASGAAIALAAQDPATMICRASAGPSAPPVGATLQVGSGFSGECVRTGKMLRCDDTETDERVDRESCRALGIRSMLAAPVRLGEKVIGLLEVFSGDPRVFRENDSAVLQRFAETILAAVVRTARAHDPAPPSPASPPSFSPAHGGVLFAAQPQNPGKTESKNHVSDHADEDADKVGGIRLPRAHLYLLIVCLAAIFLALGYILAPWIQEKVQAHGLNAEQTVLASTQRPQPAAVAAPVLETATLDQLRQLANAGDPPAEYALGVRCASGDGVKQDDKEASDWLTKAAESGNVKAEAALATRYWGGRGVPASLSQAYFWAVLARAAGDKNSKTFAEFLASHMNRAQSTGIEQKAEIWYEQHESAAKPSASR